MNLTQALGVILGANIGGTAVGWLFILKIGKYGLLLAGIGAIIEMFSKTEKGKEKSKLMMGIGLIFFGMELMKNGFEPLRAMPEFVEMFQIFHVIRNRECIFSSYGKSSFNGNSTDIWIY